MVGFLIAGHILSGLLNLLISKLNSITTIKKESLMPICTAILESDIKNVLVFISIKNREIRRSQFRQVC